MSVILCATIFYNEARKESVILTIKYIERIREILIDKYGILASAKFVNTGFPLDNPELSGLDIREVQNELHEFSGFQVLSNLHKELNSKYSCLLLINDTVPSKRYYDPAILSSLIFSLLNPASIRCKADVISRQDKFLGFEPGCLKIDGERYSARYWYSTHIFLLSQSGAKAVSEFLDRRNITNLLSGINTFALDPRVYHHIHSWIYGKSFFKWSGSESSQLSDQSIITTKIKCCILERYLYPLVTKRTMNPAKFSTLFFLLNKLIRLFPCLRPLILKVPASYLVSSL